MTLTKSWLQKAISDIETMRDEIPFGLDEDGNNTLAAFKTALAGMEEAVPVGFIARHKETGKFGSYLHPKADWFKDDNYEVLKAYDAPQPLTTSERAELENYRNTQQVVHVDADDNFYSWFGREWHEHYQHNQYTTAAKQMLGVMAESAWNACRAAMLQAGNSPVIPDGWVMVPVEPTDAMVEAMYKHQLSMRGALKAAIAAAPQQEV